MITVNDEEWVFEEGMTIEALLYKLDSRMPITVVKINNEYISRAHWDQIIKDGDDVRVIYIIAGG